MWPAKYAHLVELGTRPHALGKGSRLARVVTADRLAREDRRLAVWSRQAADPKTKPGRQEYLRGLIKRFEARRAEWVGTRQKGTRHPGAAPRPFLRPAYQATVAQSTALTQKVMADEVMRVIAKESQKLRRRGR